MLNSDCMLLCVGAGGHRVVHDFGRGCVFWESYFMGIIGLCSHVGFLVIELWDVITRNFHSVPSEDLVFGLNLVKLAWFV